MVSDVFRVDGAGVCVGRVQPQRVVRTRAGRETSRRCAPAFASWRMRDRALATSAFTSCCAAKGGGSIHKRVRRLYRLEGLQVRMRVRRRKHVALHRGPAPVAQGPQERWSMDFVHDQLADGRPFRVLTVVDQWSRSSPILECGLSLRGGDVAAALDRAIGTRQAPRSITVDHGTEFMSRALEDWAWRRGVQLDFTRPGKPTDNGYIESFNGKLRDECLNVNQFVSLPDAQQRSSVAGGLQHRPSAQLTRRPDPAGVPETLSGKAIAEAA